jgi:hypothetical protein
MPIAIAMPRHESASGAFAQYADPDKRKLEGNAFAKAMEAKYANAR